jgi:hypothetical protein
MTRSTKNGYKEPQSTDGQALRRRKSGGRAVKDSVLKKKRRDSEMLVGKP